MKDRKPRVRLEAAKGLASLYAVYVSPAWSDKHRAHEPLPRDVRAKLAWIPGHLLQAYSLPDNDLRLCVLQALDEVLLPRDSPCAARTTGLVHVWRRLALGQRHALRVVLSDRAAVQRRVQAYLGARTAWRGDVEDEACVIRLQAAGEALAEAVPPHGRVDLVGRLNETKDQQAARLLAVLADPRQPLPQLLKARDELAAKMGSKTQLGEYVRQLSRRAASCFATQETLADLLQLAQARMERGAGGGGEEDDEEEEEEDGMDFDDEEEEDEEDAGDGEALPLTPTLEAAVDLAELLLDTFPALLPKALPALLDLCWAAGRRSHARHQTAEATAAAAAVQVRVLRIVTRARPRAPANGGDSSSASQSQSQSQSQAQAAVPRLTAMGAKGEAELLQKFRTDVQRLCLKDGSPKAARLGVSALCQLVPTAADPVFAKLLRDLTAARALSLDNPRLEAVLRALAVLAERRPRAFQAHADAVRAFVLHKVGWVGGLWGWVWV